MNGSIPTFRLVVVGKTGCGKSTLCNSLLGDHRFPVAQGPGAATTEFQLERSRRSDCLLHIVDTPDVFNMGYSRPAAEKKFKEWELLGPADAPTAFLFTVGLHERFTPGDYDLYKRYRDALPEEYRNRIIFVFTFTENLTGPVREEIKLSSLQQLVSALGGRFVQLSKLDSVGQVRHSVDMIVDYIENMKAEDRVPKSEILPKIVRNLREYDFKSSRFFHMSCSAAALMLLYVIFRSTDKGKSERATV